ncbi:unnamed protein product [Prunus armeniaca]|uniref:Uncharacterized protein n=1 Tax=Prunus armeniaca TaxID=36596 RepID=A0A6J5UT65_PRUAR|nr:unnamed protein product [Prunus armeniaca]
MPSSSSSARSPFSSPNEHLDTANRIVALLANIIGAAESVLRVAAIGPDKRHLAVAGLLSHRPSYVIKAVCLKNKSWLC